MVHLNIYSELVECKKGLVLQIQTYWIFMTQEDNSISEKYPNEIQY